MPRRPPTRRILSLAAVVALAAALLITGAPSASAAAQGLWLARSDGKVLTAGAATHMGDMSGRSLNAPIVDMAAAPGGGYWLLGGDGGVFAFGAPFYGSTGDLVLNEPVVGMAPDPDGAGYWFVASDGGVFAFRAGFYGSMGGRPLNAPIIDMAESPTGKGYLLLGADGGTFAFGDVKFHGNTLGMNLRDPVVAIANDPDGEGYWIVDAGGGVHAFKAPFKGSLLTRPSSPVTEIVPTDSGQGYWLITEAGQVFAFGDAQAFRVNASAAAAGGKVVSGAAQRAVTNAAPTPADDALTTDEDTPVEADVVANDSDPDGDAVVILSVTQRGKAGGPTHGTAQRLDSKRVRYTPDPDYNGPDSFTYTVTDGRSTATATVNVTVKPVDDRPDAVSDSGFQVEPGSAITIDVLANDTGLGDGGITVTAPVNNTPSRGTVVVNPDNTVTYTATDGVASGSDDFNYAVTDVNGQLDMADVFLDVGYFPDLVDDIATVVQGNSVRIFVLANDTDVEDDPDGNSPQNLTIVEVSQPAHGTAEVTQSNLQDDGQAGLPPRDIIVYTAPATFSGKVTFTYTVEDSDGFRSTAQVNVTVVALSSDPVAVDNSYEHSRINGPLEFNPVTDDGNGSSPGGVDTIPNGLARFDVIVDSITGPGGLSCDRNGDCTYTGTPGLPATFEFDYRITDTAGKSDTAHVTINLIA